MKPKIIHQIWIGPEMPEFILKAMDSVRDQNPDFEYKRWNGDILKKYDVNPEECTTFAFLVNRLRLKLLHEYGGLYIDADTICNKSLSEWYKKYQIEPLYSNFTEDLYPGGGVTIADPGIDFYLAEVDYNCKEPHGFYFARMRPGLIPEKEIGPGGEYLNDLRYNSWLKDQQNNVNQLIKLKS